ncbi:MAG: alpha/beta fold hydrolase [Oculatellaceae cyanobacterium Prado106]|nr:alpha/beta fold hydrolase [Oculatellaceae cyanobacterium Prado106]
MSQPVTQCIDIGALKLCLRQAGSGSAVMFLHGLGWDHHLWDSAFERYGDRHHLIAGDTRGHGQSDKPPTPYSIRQFAEDWLQVLDRLQINTLKIIGFSQGSMIAMQMALLQPDRFSACLFAATTCCNPPEVDANMQQRIALLDQMGAEAAAKLASESIFSPRFIRQHPQYIAEFIQRRAASDQASLKRAMLATTGFNLCEQLQRLHQPCWVMAGADDRLTPPALAQQVQDHLPNSKFIILPDTGHMMPIEQPEPFYQWIDAFLDVT